ncbi:hypothetical protein [Methylomonas koyamae]|uniref:hypothetical protein n=1 Tax=Methylomonas koyamae TaxID=702114 RepID=UPI002873EECB|nr:hypothetical protein [Methylomonas koyamae]WNB78046.1 hypothetical protein RI210_10780 [Methylomonas koyamae]
MGSMQYIGDGTILPCRTMPYELPSHLAQRINAACGGDKINSLLGGLVAITIAGAIKYTVYTSFFENALKSLSNMNNAVLSMLPQQGQPATSRPRFTTLNTNPTITPALQQTRNNDTDYPPNEHPSKWDYIKNADKVYWYHKQTRAKVCEPT